MVAEKVEGVRVANVAKELVLSVAVSALRFAFEEADCGVPAPNTQAPLPAALFPRARTR